MSGFTVYWPKWSEIKTATLTMKRTDFNHKYKSQNVDVAQKEETVLFACIPFFQYEMHIFQTSLRFLSS
jgi:hypothetical protein